jgi:hypothetical protein
MGHSLYAPPSVQAVEREWSVPSKLRIVGKAHATDQIARTVIEDLIGYVGGEQSYILRCEPMDKGFCFISVLQDTIRKPPTAPQSGVCSALGYDGY